MIAPATPNTPPATVPAPPASPAQSRTADAIASARVRLADGKSLVDIPDEASAPVAGAEQSTGAAPPPAGDEAPKFTVTLPGLEERGEAALELEAPDQETYDRLTRFQQEAVVGREVKAEQRGVADLRRQLAEVEDKIGGDPAGFVLAQMPEATRAEIAMQLFFEPGVLDAIQAKLREAGYEGGVLDVAESPDALRTLRAELKASRLEMRDTLQQRRQVETAMQANARAIIAEIEHLVPTHLADEQRARVVEDAVRDISDRCRRLGLTQLDPADVRPLVEQRLRALGPMTARRSSAPAAAPSRPARPAAPALPTGTKARIELAKKIGLEALLARARATT